jgi:uncharacterized repeat protein (TIGR02543 family)
MFISFVADRNPGKDREMLARIRWPGGGINFTVVQREAPYANNPMLNGGGTMSLTARATIDGAVLHYATDGEEPSDASPVFNGVLEFDETTECAVKAYAEWMQASDTVYADVVGKGSQWDEIEISFAPAMAGVAAPAKRTYKVNETFGELPSFPKTNGLYFKGWTLHEGSERLVSGGDSVPSVDAVLYGVWSETTDDMPSWTALPWNFDYSMEIVAVVSNAMTGAILSPDECCVGVVDGSGVCRGSTDNGLGDISSPLNGKNGMHAFGIYANAESEQGLAIRVWERKKGFLLATEPSIAFAAGEIVGSEDAPFLIVVRPSRYTVVFHSNGGTGDMADQAMVCGSACALAANAFTKYGCSFIGWSQNAGGAVAYLDCEMVKNLTFVDGGTVDLYASWAPNVFRATFNANGGQGGKVVTLAYGAALSAPAVTRNGYTFAGWRPAVPATMPAANATYVAQWTKKADPPPNPTYKVAFSANGGKLPKGKTMKALAMTYGTSKKLSGNLFTRKGYVFIGWSTKKNGPLEFANKASVRNLTTKGGTVTLYAQWAKEKYKVAFDKNGGTLPKGRTMAAQTMTYGKAAKLRKNVFTRKGYKFAGWATSKANAKKGIVKYKDRKSVKNLVANGKTVKLYAVWKRK